MEMKIDIKHGKLSRLFTQHFWPLNKHLSERKGKLFARLATPFFTVLHSELSNK